MAASAPRRKSSSASSTCPLDAAHMSSVRPSNRPPVAGTFTAPGSASSAAATSRILLFSASCIGTTIALRLGRAKLIARLILFYFLRLILRQASGAFGRVGEHQVCKSRYTASACTRPPRARPVRRLAPSPECLCLPRPPRFRFIKISSYLRILAKMKITETRRTRGLPPHDRSTRPSLQGHHCTPSPLRCKPAPCLGGRVQLSTFLGVNIAALPILLEQKLLECDFTIVSHGAASDCE